MSQKKESKKEMRPHGSIVSCHTYTETPSPHNLNAITTQLCILLQLPDKVSEIHSSALKKIDEMKTSVRRVITYLY